MWGTTTSPYLRSSLALPLCKLKTRNVFTCRYLTSYFLIRNIVYSKEMRVETLASLTWEQIVLNSVGLPSEDGYMKIYCKAILSLPSLVAWLSNLLFYFSLILNSCCKWMPEEEEEEGRRRRKRGGGRGRRRIILEFPYSTA